MSYASSTTPAQIYTISGFPVGIGTAGGYIDTIQGAPQILTQSGTTPAGTTPAATTPAGSMQSGQLEKIIFGVFIVGILLIVFFK